LIRSIQIALALLGFTVVATLLAHGAMGHDKQKAAYNRQVLEGRSFLLDACRR